MSGPPPPLPDGPGRRLVVLRHGQTTSNAAGVWQGQLDSPLSPLGEEQAAAAGPALAALGPVRVVTSDLQRARLTGAAVARAAEVPLVEDQRLREIHAGAWQGLTNDEIVQRWPGEHAALRRGEDVTRPGGGESLADVRERMGDALRDVLAATGPGECVVVSTHGAAGRAGVSWLLGLDMLVSWRVLGALGNCHWAELAEGRQGWRLRTWNVSVGAGSPEGTFAP
ncbi:histidine phosphatase family protein [Nostocoides sp. Soil756]|uniref:histidine phosphatase family protein n=1 Tax=Nostocoides sp. Soil756 TaxID=1736399 RepID=UPI0006F89652|nr:histidine phosphatase family protein [Tetrasphaera sp. Soil756]KRE61601.1 phosphoglycerate mutase [Tetrasphaera sp. Soil756]